MHLLLSTIFDSGFSPDRLPSKLWPAFKRLWTAGHLIIEVRGTSMSSEPVVPLNNAEKEESPFVAPGTDQSLRGDGRVSAASTDRLLERNYPDVRPLGEIPGEANPRLRESAESVGTAVGRAVNAAKDLPRRLSQMKDRFTVIRGRTQEQASATAGEVRESAKQQFEQARTRIQHYAHEYPLQFIAGVGAACVVLGMILRVWRSSRHE